MRLEVLFQLLGESSQLLTGNSTVMKVASWKKEDTELGMLCDAGQKAKLIALTRALQMS